MLGDEVRSKSDGGSAWCRWQRMSFSLAHDILSAVSPYTVARSTFASSRTAHLASLGS